MGAGHCGIPIGAFQVHRASVREAVPDEVVGSRVVPQGVVDDAIASRRWLRLKQ
jgi:hypothetical protein